MFRYSPIGLRPARTADCISYLKHEELLPGTVALSRTEVQQIELKNHNGGADVPGMEKVQLRVATSVRKMNDDICASVSVRLVEQEPASLQLCCRIKFRLTESAGNTISHYATLPRFLGKGESCNIATSLEQRSCLARHVREGPVKATTSIEVIFGLLPDPSKLGISLTEIQSAVTFANQIKEAYAISNDSDFTLVSSDGEEFRVHRLILRACSPVFAAMLSHNMREARERKCSISDVDGRTLKALVKYMYGCGTDISGVIAAKLLEAAEKYDIAHLKDICEAILFEEERKESAEID